MSVHNQIASIFKTHQNNSRMLVKALIRNVRTIAKEYGEDAVNRELASYYPFFEHDPNSQLRAYLLNKFEAVNNGATLKRFTDIYAENGFLVVLCGDLYKAITPNQKTNREMYPYQCSIWSVERGVLGDANYQSLGSAIKEEGILCEIPLVDEALLLELETALVNAEHQFQSNYFKTHQQFHIR
ncbi:hypothetical protein [Shewanella aestuarii]|uniref:Uncharacterized protein n=1 Tax=Shewanella aestuarii TaxID=1028752 RepID=A0A6G9QQE2_9GAMM|nr:hypothetical protein [Shewanella aestuarii]QIR16638.1 hypothetical protein HBH39_19375 [Shewanella aestuarii]